MGNNDCEVCGGFLKFFVVAALLLSPGVVFYGLNLALYLPQLQYDYGLTTVNVPAIKLVSQLGMALLLSLVSFFAQSYKFKTIVLYTLVIIFLGAGVVCFCSLPSVLPAVIIGSCDLIIMQIPFMELLEYQSASKTSVGQLYALILSVCFSIIASLTQNYVWMAQLTKSQLMFVYYPESRRNWLIGYCIFGALAAGTKFWFSALIDKADEKSKQEKQEEEEEAYEPENNAKFMFMQLFSVFLISVGQAFPEYYGSSAFPFFYLYVLFMLIFTLSQLALYCCASRRIAMTIYTVTSVVFSVVVVALQLILADLRSCYFIQMAETAMYFGTFDMATVHGHTAYFSYLAAQAIVSYVISTKNTDFLVFQTYYDTQSSETVTDTRALLCVFLIMLIVQCVFYVVVQCCKPEREYILNYVMLGVCAVGALVSGIFLGVLLKSYPATTESDPLSAGYFALQQTQARALQRNWFFFFDKTPQLNPDEPNPSVDQVALRFELRVVHAYSALIVCGLFLIVCAFDAIDYARRKKKYSDRWENGHNASKASVVTSEAQEIFVSSTK